MNHYLGIFIKYSNYSENLVNVNLSLEKVYDGFKTNPSSSYNYAYYFYHFFKYYAIPFFILFIVSMLIVIIVNRYTYQQLIYPKKVLELRIDAFLIELLYAGYSLKVTKEKIAIFKQNGKIPFEKKWCKELILKKIIEINQNLQGFIPPNQMLLIYKYFGFEDYSKKLIQSRKGHKKMMGIYHFQMLDHKIKKGYVRSYINSKNKYLKSNALIALISLSDEKLEFLTNYEEKISRADELKILEIIYQKSAALPENINDWLINENSSIVQLAIKLMIQNRKSLTVSQIELLLNNKKKKIRKETLLAIRELVILDSNPLLIDYYSKETDKRNKISTLKTMGVIGDDKTKDFVANLLLEEKDLDLKFEMVSCINKIDKTFFYDYKTDDAFDNELHRILLHVNSPHLN